VRDVTPMSATTSIGGTGGTCGTCGTGTVRLQVRRTVRQASAAPLDLRTPSGRRLPF
jgi:cobalamin biosynthesis protein CbiD